MVIDDLARMRIKKALRRFAEANKQYKEACRAEGVDSPRVIVFACGDVEAKQTTNADRRARVGWLVVPDDSNDPRSIALAVSGGLRLLDVYQLPAPARPRPAKRDERELRRHEQAV